MYQCAPQPLQFGSASMETFLVSINLTFPAAAGAAGKPALLALPGPNPSNDNSAAVVAFQVGTELQAAGAQMLS